MTPQSHWVEASTSRQDRASLQFSRGWKDVTFLCHSFVRVPTGCAAPPGVQQAKHLFLRSKEPLQRACRQAACARKSMPNDEFIGTILRMGARDRYALVEAACMGSKKSVPHVLFFPQLIASGLCLVFIDPRGDQQAGPYPSWPHRLLLLVLDLAQQERGLLACRHCCRTVR